MASNLAPLTLGGNPAGLVFAGLAMAQAGGGGGQEVASQVRRFMISRAWPGLREFLSGKTDILSSQSIQF